ncbi:MAG: threonine/serine dehydratase [Candidatus Dormibacteria bacterium]
MTSASTFDAKLDIESALERLSGRVHRTPLLHSRLLDDAAGARLWLKAENFQRAGSFKTRGAFNAALVGLESGDNRGLAALSSGNHGQAVALAASELGLTAVVVMAEGSSPVKIAAVRGYGAEVISRGVSISNREEIAVNLAAERGLRLIHPHDDPHVISGQATVGCELAVQLRSRGVEEPVVLVPLGGGGLLSGILLALRRWLPKATIVGVEPELGNDGVLSLASGRRVTLPVAPATVADGAATLRLGALCWEIIRQEVDEIVTVSERQIGEACWWLWSRCKQVVEPTGAMTTAAALGGVGSFASTNRTGSGGSSPRDLVCLISGGNCLPNQIARLIETASEESPPR